MANGVLKKILIALIFVLAVALIITGTVGMSRRSSAYGSETLEAMCTRAVLVATGEGAVESYVEIAKDDARALAKEQGMSIKETKALVEQAETDARANYSSNLIDYDKTDISGLAAPLAELRLANEAYFETEAAAQAAYIAAMGDSVRQEEEEEDVSEMTSEADLEAAMMEEETKVDLSGFTETEEMLALRAVVDEKYALVGAELMKIYEALDDAALSILKSTIIDIISQSGDDFASRFDRYALAGGSAALTNGFGAKVARYADDLIYIGVGLVIFGFALMFSKKIVKALGIPRLIIGAFFVILCIVALLCDISLTGLVSSSLVRLGMNSILVLAMVPGIQCGIGLNLGLPVGIVGGLIGGLLAIEFRIGGWLGFIMAIAVGVMIAAFFGWVYGTLLNHLKGSEMSVTTYVGFSFVSLMCIAWLVLPFKSLELRWPMGTGLRNTVTMKSTFGKLLDEFLAFNIGGLKIPTGLLLFMCLCCFLVWLFMRSKTGIAMRAVGDNLRFAEATGVNVDKMRIIGTVFSTVLGAVGILVYSQSYGFMQLYTAPRQMGFVAASAILIGGASTTHCKISHVIIGTFLFQGVLTLGMPIANALVPQSTISETLRILVSNGIILYALTKSGGELRA